MKPLVIVVEKYAVSFVGTAPTVELTLRIDIRDRVAVLDAMDDVRACNNLEPLVRLWLTRLPPAERLKLITEAVSDRLTESDGK